MTTGIAHSITATDNTGAQRLDDALATKTTWLTYDLAVMAKEKN